MSIRDMQKTRLRHVGIVVKDINESVKLYKKMGFKVSERETLEVVKMIDKDGSVFELVQGKWKPHLAVLFYEDFDGNLLEVVCQSKS